jgi:hypothetical protein
LWYQATTGEIWLGCPGHFVNRVNQVPIFEEETMPFFGHLDGNFQPSGDAFEFDPVATGGQVSNQKVAVTSINNKDGVGNGKDFYTL